MKSSFGVHCVYSMIIGIGRCLQWLPYPLTLVPGTGIAALFFLVAPGRLFIALQNIGIVFPDRSRWWRLRICFLSYLHHGLSLWELLCCPASAQPRIARVLALDEEDRTLLSMGGIIFVMPHGGCWEQAVCSMGALQKGAFYVYRKMHSGFAEELVRSIRKSHGTGLVCSKGAVGAAETLLAESHSVWFALDHHFTSREGVPVSFFKKQISAAPGPAVLQGKTRCRVLVGGFFRDWNNGSYRLIKEQFIEPVKDMQSESAFIGTQTQACFSGLEHLVQRYPEQYWWFHKLFKKSHQYG